jgi:hypothetical protein
VLTGKEFVVVLAEDIRRVILKLADERGREGTFCTSDIARAVDQKNWKILLEQVRLVAGTLIHEGKIAATRSGKHVDVDDAEEPLLFRKI